MILPAIAGLMAWQMARSWRARASEGHWLPKELQHAQLAFAEKTFRTWQPIGLIARADRGYRLKGELHLAEFKTRTHAVAYSSDVIELSAQRLVIEKSTRERVSELLAFAFIYNGHDRWNAKSAIDQMGATLASFARE